MDSDGLCVCEGWELVGSVRAVLREQAALLRIGHRGTLRLTVRACTPGATTTRPLMLCMAEAEVIVP